MNFEKLREEFSHVASFLKWDNSEIKNGLVKNFNEKDVNTSAIYLAMNPRGSNQEIIDIYKNNSPEEIYEKTDLQAWHFVHNIPNGPFNNKNDISLLNRQITNSKLEGAYFTDFFKISPDSENIDGWWSTSSKEILDYFYDLEREEKDNILKKQLSSLNREVELLDIKNPKFIVMNTCFDLVSYALNELVNEDEFPHLIDYEIVDRIYSYKHSLSNFELNLTNKILRKIDFTSYPRNLLYKIQRNAELISELKEKYKPKEILAILYHAYTEKLKKYSKNNINTSAKIYLDKILYDNQEVIDRMIDRFSKEIIKEIYKNFFEIFCGYEKNNDFKYKIRSNVLISNSLDPSYIDFFDTIPDHIYYAGNEKDKLDFAQIYLLFENKDILKIDEQNNINQHLDIIINQSEEMPLTIRNLIKENRVDNCILISDHKKARNTYKKIKEEYSKYLINVAAYENSFYIFYLSNHFKYGNSNDIKKFENLFLTENESSNHENVSKITHHIIRGVHINNDDIKDLFQKEESSLIYISSRDIVNNKIVDNKLYVKDKYRDKFTKYIGKENDIIISRTLPLKVSIVESGRSYLISDSLYIIKSKINPLYLIAYFESYEFDNQINTQIRQNKSKVLTKKILENLSIPLTDTSDQDSIAKKYKAYKDKLDSLSKEIDNLNNSIKGLF